MRTLVIAGSYDQFRYRFKASYEDHKYLAVLPDDLRGEENSALILCGTYRLRKDYVDNEEEEILEYCRRHSISIKRLMEEPISRN